MVENVTSIKSEITISIGVSLKIKKKKKKYVCKKVFFGILQHTATKMVNMQEVLLVIQ